jgi:hypothetical protein
MAGTGPVMMATHVEGGYPLNPSARFWRLRRAWHSREVLHQRHDVKRGPSNGGRFERKCALIIAVAYCVLN